MITRRHLVTAVVVGFAMGRPSAAFAAYKVTHSDDEWRELLTPDQYSVMRQGTTEEPYTSALLNEHRRGTFACAGCGQKLFSAYAKYDSHTGWPSFTEPLRHAIATRTDLSERQVRKEVHCTECGCHIGHVFDDGPRPTGLRYCMNGIAMTFNPA